MPPSEPVFLGLNEGTWFAIIALLVALVVSIVATVVGYRSAAKDRATRTELSREEREHEEAMAREEREQARRLTAYSELATHLDRMAEWALRTMPPVQLEPAPPMPVAPDKEELRRQLATARLVGSPAVRGLLAELWEANNEFQLAVWQEQLLANTGLPPAETAEERAASWRDLQAKRRLVVEAVNRLEAQMRSDLGIVDAADPAAAPEAK
jgi:hypothetical protein